MYPVASQDRPSAMFFSFLWPLSALEFGVRDVFESVLGYLIPFDEVACVCWVFDSTSYSLEEPSNFICRRFSPCLPSVRIGMVYELPMLEHFARLDVHHC